MNNSNVLCQAEALCKPIEPDILGVTDVITSFEHGWINNDSSECLPSNEITRLRNKFLGLTKQMSELETRQAFLQKLSKFKVAAVCAFFFRFISLSYFFAGFNE